MSLEDIEGEEEECMSSVGIVVECLSYSLVGIAEEYQGCRSWVDTVVECCSWGFVVVGLKKIDKTSMAVVDRGTARSSLEVGLGVGMMCYKILNNNRMVGLSESMGLVSNMRVGFELLRISSLLGFLAKEVLC